MINWKKHTIFVLIITFLVSLAAGCGSQETKKAPVSKEQAPLKIGVTAGPQAEIMEVVRKIAEKQGLAIKIVEFNDFVQPNVALNQGDLDANSMQHQPYLDNTVKDRKFDLVSVAKTIIMPMAVYSKKVKDLKDLPSNAVIAIPNDPTNGSRALLLLQQAGLIKLKAGGNITSIVADIIENPKNFKIKELDAAQIPRSLQDVDAAAVNTNYALAAGMLPTKESLAIENANSPYTCVIAVRTKDKDNERIRQLIKAYQSDEVKKFVNEKFGDSLVAGW